MTDVYRRAASMLLLRPTDGGYEFLLLHKPRKGDAWQLPQGGIEAGEDVATAALRELQEEASVTGARVLAVSDKVYQYDFPAGYRRFRPDNVKGQRIEFVLALAWENATVTVDNNEIDQYVWVTVDSMATYVKRKQYAELVKELYAEALHLLG
jgi:putative (di)nucleoside polyphosphate hydrolase